MNIKTAKYKILATAVCTLLAASVVLPLGTQAVRADDSTPAASPAATKGGTHAGGSVTAVDASAKTITIQSKKGGSKTFTVGDSAKITGADGAAAALTDIKTGDHVRISFTTGDDGTLTAVSIKVGGGKASK